jgi:exosortase K
MKSKAILGAQFSVVLLCALGLKHYYSTASPNQLRWVLAPTTWLVELLSGKSFTFESHAGYMSSDHSFLIAASCAGVNFLITAFLVLSLRNLWRQRNKAWSWHIIPASACIAYVATIGANTVRIWIALESRTLTEQLRWLSASQSHRLQGIGVYFGFLLILFLLTEKKKYLSVGDLLQQLRLPLLVYYATTLGIPLVNGAFQQWEFWEHALFVLLVPVVLIGFALGLHLAGSVWTKSSVRDTRVKSGLEHVGDSSLGSLRA